MQTVRSRPISHEVGISSIINRFRAEDYQLVDWSQVAGIKEIPVEENVVEKIHNILYQEIKDALDDRVFDHKERLRLEILDTATSLTQAMRFHGMPSHLVPTMEKWHYTRVATERLSTPHSLASIFRADCSDENASSLNYIPFRLLPSKKLLVLDFPSWVMEVPE